MNAQPPACIGCAHRHTPGLGFSTRPAQCRRRQGEWHFDPVSGQTLHDGTFHACQDERAAPGWSDRALALIGLAPDRCGPAGRYFQPRAMPAPPTGGSAAGPRGGIHHRSSNSFARKSTDD